MIKNIFFVIGVFSSILIVLTSTIFIYEFSREKPIDKASCMDGSIIFLGTKYFNDNYYEVIYQISGSHDKTHSISLYKNTYPSNKSCIAYDELINYTSIDYGAENEPETQWPTEIRIENETINIKYTQNKSSAIHIANIVPVWEKQ